MAHDVFVSITHLVERSHSQSIALEVSASFPRRPSVPIMTRGRTHLAIALTEFP
jgi:hypothetical protein